MLQAEKGKAIELPPSDVQDWIGSAGILRVEGVDYHLPSMEPHELNALHAEISIHADAIRAQLTRSELAESMAALTNDAQVWRNRARFALALKKRMMRAIHQEFARRKTLIPPLSEFAFKAVNDCFGEVGLARVLARARILQDELQKQIERHGAAPSYRYGDKDKVCGDKVRYNSEKAAEMCLDAMEMAGINMKGMSAYGPCPWCGQFHVGHRPGYQNRKSRKVRNALEAAALTRMSDSSHIH